MFRLTVKEMFLLVLKEFNTGFSRCFDLFSFILFALIMLKVIRFLRDPENNTLNRGTIFRYAMLSLVFEMIAGTFAIANYLVFG